MADRSPARDAWRSLAFAGLALALTQVAATTILASEPLLPFRRAFVAVPLLVPILVGVAYGRGPALAASVPTCAYVVYFFAVFGTAPGLTDRLTLGVAIGVFGAATAVLVGHLRGRSLDLAERALAKEREEAAGERARALELEALNRALEERNRTLRDFSHVVAHDLKNPVRGLRALLQELERAIRARGRVESLLPDVELAARTAARLDDLLDSLLDYSRITQLDAPDLRALAPHEVAQADLCRARYASLARERGARVAIEPAGVRVLAHEGALSLVLGNLIANAIRHNPRPDPAVSVATRLEDGRAVILVDDNGPGVPEEVRARLGRAAGASPGARSGFGLPMVERALVRMRGALEIGTSPEGGARMRVVLQRAD